jgi:hypothetical protein
VKTLASFQNTFNYGDNLDVLKRYLKDETVDLIYLDPTVEWPIKLSKKYL